MASQEVRIPQSNEERIDDPAGGSSYRLRVAWPFEPPPAGGYPVLYVLDADVIFGTVVEAVRSRSRRTASTGVLPAIVAGIAHDGDRTAVRAARAFDFTPGPALDRPAPADGDGTPAAPQTGGAPAFLRFLTGAVRAAVEGRYPVDAGRRVLMGHSLAGLFVVHALLAEPGAFSDFVAVSPSLWWNRPWLAAALDTWDARLPAESAPNVWIGVGEYEQAIAPWQSALPPAVAEKRASRTMVDSACDLAATLDHVARGRSRIQFVPIPGEDHASVLGPALSHALRFALAERNRVS